MTEQNATIDARLSELGLTITAEFVPASTFKDDEWKRGAVNFEIKIDRQNGDAPAYPIYRGPYAYGVGNLPSYSAKVARTRDGAAMVKNAVNSGKWHRDPYCMTFHAKSVPAPALRDVMYSLLMDASAIDHGSFESWASDYGYDADSRSAEATYRACLDTGLKLRAALGDSVLAELRELFQDY